MLAASMTGHRAEPSLHRAAERLEAAATIERVMRALAKSSSNLVAEVLDPGGFSVWEHQPKGDVYGPESCAQYYYHAHPKSADGTGVHDGEHGHFHTFLRGPAITARAHESNAEVPADPEAISAALIGIGMNEMGAPISLFTTNRWVTGEVWYAAGDVTLMLDRFEIELAAPSYPLNLFITAMLRLYRPEIEALLQERDRRVAAFARAHPGTNAFEDRRLEVTSHLAIDLAGDIEALLALRH
jgi:hypothetical protein